jgi:hypothetical protein
MTRDRRRDRLTSGHQRLARHAGEPAHAVRLAAGRRPTPDTYDVVRTSSEVSTKVSLPAAPVIVSELAPPSSAFLASLPTSALSSSLPVTLALACPVGVSFSIAWLVRPNLTELLRRFGSQPINDFNTGIALPATPRKPERLVMKSVADVMFDATALRPLAAAVILLMASTNSGSLILSR